MELATQSIFAVLLEAAYTEIIGRACPQHWADTGYGRQNFGGLLDKLSV